MVYNEKTTTILSLEWTILCVLVGGICSGWAFFNMIRKMKFMKRFPLEFNVVLFSFLVCTGYGLLEVVIDTMKLMKKPEGIDVLQSAETFVWDLSECGLCVCVTGLAIHRSRNVFKKNLRAPGTLLDFGFAVMALLASAIWSTLSFCLNLSTKARGIVSIIYITLFLLIMIVNYILVMKFYYLRKANVGTCPENQFGKGTIATRHRVKNSGQNQSLLFFSRNADDSHSIHGDGDDHGDDPAFLKRTTEDGNEREKEEKEIDRDNTQAYSIPDDIPKVTVDETYLPSTAEHEFEDEEKDTDTTLDQTLKTNDGFFKHEADSEVLPIRSDSPGISLTLVTQIQSAESSQQSSPGVFITNKKHYPIKVLAVLPGSIDALTPELGHAETVSLSSSIFSFESSSNLLSRGMVTTDNSPPISRKFVAKDHDDSSKSGYYSRRKKKFSAREQRPGTSCSKMSFSSRRSGRKQEQDLLLENIESESDAHDEVFKETNIDAQEEIGAKDEGPRAVNLIQWLYGTIGRTSIRPTTHQIQPQIQQRHVQFSHMGIKRNATKTETSNQIWTIFKDTVLICHVLLTLTPYAIARCLEMNESQIKRNQTWYIIFRGLGLSCFALAPYAYVLFNKGLRQIFRSKYIVNRAKC